MIGPAVLIVDGKVISKGILKVLGTFDLCAIGDLEPPPSGRLTEGELSSALQAAGVPKDRNKPLPYYHGKRRF